MYPSEYRYHHDHYWIHDQRGVWALGITDYAQRELQEITYVELPKQGGRFHAGDSIGMVESIKASVELCTPVSGEVVEANVDLLRWPGLLNDDPHGAGWLIKIRCSAADEFDSLMSAEEYEQWSASRHKSKAR
jgi:glycine cleavage system H protein